MSQKRSNPAVRAERTGLGNVIAGERDTRVNDTTPSEIQAIWIARRYRVSIDRARLVAALAFGRAA
jgi:hypothetical protein